MDHFITAGETLLAGGYETFCGGKGANQSVAAARAGAQVCHAGMLGPDGEPLLRLLESSGVDIERIKTLPHSVCGHAVIQVLPTGQNCILVHSGANGEVDQAYIDQVLSAFGPEDLLLLQNETSNVPYAIRAAKARGIAVALNPSPVTPELMDYPLDLVDYLILNEVEGEALSGRRDYAEIADVLSARWPEAHILLTLGRAGVLYRHGAVHKSHGAYEVPTVDTTGAGDTFCGYFLAGVAQNRDIDRALAFASRAAALAVSRRGAAGSIPTAKEVEDAFCVE